MRAPARLLLLAAVLSLPFWGCSRSDTPAPAPRQPGDAAAASRYAGYRFGGKDVIDLGGQPLTLPEATVAELLSRDATLAARLKKEGAGLQVFPFYKGRDINDFMTSGDLEGGIYADMPAITAAATGEVVIVAMLKQGFASIVSRKPLLVRELKGKRVATGIGSAAHFTLLNALENEGLSEADIILVPMEVSDMPQALAQGEIDAFSAWEPTPVLAFAAHPEFHLVHKGLSYGFLCLRRDFVKAHPARAREIVAAVARSCFWMRLPGNLERLAGWTGEAAARMQGKPYPLKPEQMVSLTRNDLLNVPASPRIPDALLTEQGLLYKKFVFLKKAGKIPASTPWGKVRDSFDTEMLRQVMARGDGYALERFDYRAPDAMDGAQ